MLVCNDMLLTGVSSNAVSFAMAGGMLWMPPCTTAVKRTEKTSSQMADSGLEIDNTHAFFKGAHTHHGKTPYLPLSKCGNT